MERDLQQQLNDNKVIVLTGKESEENMDEFAKYMEKRNVIDNISHTQLTKKEVLELIDKTFPDEEVGNHGQIAQVTTTEMSDGTKMQSICFGKMFKV